MNVEIVVTEENGLFRAGYYMVDNIKGSHYPPRSGESADEALQNLREDLENRIAVYTAVLAKMEAQ